MKKVSLCTLHIPVNVVELTSTGSRSTSCLKTKLRVEWDLNPECPALESSTLNSTPEKNAHFVKDYSPNNSFIDER